jgi:hypothetical protein
MEDVGRFCFVFSCQIDSFRIDYFLSFVSQDITYPTFQNGFPLFNALDQHVASQVS